jgi:hypothetical protein
MKTGNTLTVLGAALLGVLAMSALALPALGLTIPQTLLLRADQVIE